MHQVSRENAEKQLELLLDYYEIELEKRLKSDDAEKAQAVADSVQDILIRAITKGRLEIDEDPEDGGIRIIQTLRRPVGEVSQIRYYEVTGRARTAIKDVEKGSIYNKMYSLLSAVSKQPIVVFHRMGGVDLTTAETLFTVFSLV